jgi:plasmid stabilization system protein ParE
LNQSFRLLRQAARELDLARRWYDDQRFGLGLVFFDAFEAAVERALTFPDAGIAVLDEGLPRPVRRFPVSGFPFYVVTTVLDDGLVVVAVAHAKRKPAYWLERIK